MTTREGLGRALGAIVIAAALVGGLAVNAATAQGPPIQIAGRVLWLSAQNMAVAPYGVAISPGGTSTVNVDLSQLDQDEYMGLAEGDPVLVTGTISRGAQRVIATSIERLGS